MRALVVDDSKAMRRILTGILKQVGFDEIAQAGDGLEALDFLRHNDRPDLALVDWNMPNMNGYDFLRMVRTRRDFDGLRVVMVTTETETDRVLAALEAGADEYVMKPFTPDVVRDKLEMIGILPG